MFIAYPFLAMHRARGNNSDQPTITAQREADVKQSPDVRVPESMQPNFANTVADILDDQQWIVEEDLLGLGLTDVMLFYALAAISFIPIKSFNPRKIKHVVYYQHIQR